MNIVEAAMCVGRCAAQESARATNQTGGRVAALTEHEVAEREQAQEVINAWYQEQAELEAQAELETEAEED